MSGTRSGVYLSTREAAELERLSAEYGFTRSGVLRIGLRLLAGLPVPREARELLLASPVGRDRPEVHLAR